MMVAFIFSFLSRCARSLVCFAARCLRATKVAGTHSAITVREGQFHCRESNKNFTIIGQNNQNIDSLRKNASETRDPFRSRVINVGRRKENRRGEAIGFEISVRRGANAMQGCRQGDSG